MNAKGLRRACLYSCCGCYQVERKGLGKELLDFLKRKSPGKKQCEFIIKILKNLHPYKGYCLIRDLKGLRSPFNPNVVRDYWLGDNKLETYNLSHNFATLAQFREINSDEHLPDRIANSIFDCAVSFGEIIEVGLKKSRVLNYRLLYKKGRVVFREEIREVDTRFVDNLQKGDLVSIHWAIAREKISESQAKNLKDSTLKALSDLQGVWHD